ncbi:WxcM-like%2C C-terminal [Bordetella ansorpii]|uniref:WxcM-like, C-terminal n=1 Tax=Bordetella ansorpii TaxID=288768 RepID=A0A157S9P9_9BORD|nr:FdtA/QdtA family cupin domain-containing protein [Bordetella ansorpii]SAI67138.1 WxcM-like%2C C-terminal [Bordetella ansorpii]
MTLASIDDCTLISFPRIVDPRGSLTFMEGNRHVPFEMRRVFYLYGIEPGESRGAHAHRELHQLLICVAGGFEVEVDDGRSQRLVPLSDPWVGLHVPPMIWAAQVRFQPGSVCLVLASEKYEESDYIRNYDDFLATVRGQS